MENFSHAKYSIWWPEADRPGSYICMLNSYDVTLGEDGKLSSGFIGKQLYVGDTSGNKLMCSAFEVERTANYVKYVIPAIIHFDNGGRIYDVTDAYIHFRVDQTHPEGIIIGVYKEFDSDSTMFPNRDLFDLEEGMVVAPFLYARAIKFKPDGVPAPFEEWMSTIGICPDFVVTGDFIVTIEDSPPDTEYCCLFAITDTQGNQYFTKPIYLKTDD
jgi:hypothetical protein